jgi:hypothetical protein
LAFSKYKEAWMLPFVSEILLQAVQEKILMIKQIPYFIIHILR